MNRADMICTRLFEDPSLLRKGKDMALRFD